ncbi:MAG TPA: hypothetical protein VKR21_11770 [Solirubrobacteraceae bacterium]|nr:hypothetical protein [Solirubrobacteraceae bacterium]
MVRGWVEVTVVRVLRRVGDDLRVVDFRAVLERLVLARLVLARPVLARPVPARLVVFRLLLVLRVLLRRGAVFVPPPRLLVVAMSLLRSQVA